MSHRMDVLTAAKALVAGALVGAEVIGLENAADRPVRVSPLGTAIVRDGDPGEASIDLSPPRYHYDHAIPVELLALESPNVPTRARLDQMAGAIGAAVDNDRTLGGLCAHVDVTPLEIADLTVSGGASQMGAQFEIIASYSTTSPLG
ncbi:hypothetical protein [Sphingobium aromaticiconvertens]|uniref:hypothetical protein n=1 Tax=Sphingobium aromaticiconvertens TaxID=365341 RepID=UPI0030189827